MNEQLENLLRNITALCESFFVIFQNVTITREELGDEQIRKLQDNIALLCKILLILSGNATGADFTVTDDKKVLYFHVKETEKRPVAGLFRLSPPLQAMHERRDGE